ncbi:hypothetical protein MN869_05505 [Acinetobacter sp. NIPH1876]|nr:hypothetical protein [Acinetobacter sp. NIPH1876]MCJ0827913.1 hypothetical protein [Acinetobacter sp. NIPH1876]
MGCASSTASSPKIPANLLTPCPDLQQLESGQGSVLMLWAIDVVIKYNECQAKHGAIVKVL